LLEHLDSLDDEDCLLLDCPGQLELYTNHSGIIQKLFEGLTMQRDFRLVSIFCVDAAFLVDTHKFLSGCLLALSAMIAMELPHINVLTKCDLMSRDAVERILEMGSATQIRDLEGTTRDRNSRFGDLTASICQLLDDWQMVSFVPLNVDDEDSVQHVLATADHAVQYGEDLEVQTGDYEHDYGEQGEEANDEQI